MRYPTRRPRAALAALGLAAAAPLLAACGSSSGHAATATNASAVATSSHVADIRIAHGRAGSYLTDSRGRALYLWMADGRNVSHCSGACAAVWPRLTVSGRPTAAAGVRASALATIGRGRARQVSYDGHPLYLYAGDRHAGATTGQGSDGFGARWWLVSPRGTAITGRGPASARASSAASTTGGTGSGSGGGQSSGSGW